MKIIEKVVSIKDVAKVRDRLIKLFEKEKNKLVNPQGLDIDEQEQYENTIDWVIDELNDAFDFDGEEE